MLDISTLRRTAAEIAALALSELYPGVHLLGGGETPLGFYYDFSIPYPVHIHLVEEKMRQIIREKREIRTLEMVPFSAAELLKSEGLLSRLGELSGEEGLVELIQIGKFYDLSPGPHLKNTAGLAAFKISMEPLPENSIRILGWCEQSKDALKQFLKKLDQYTEPAVLGERMKLWKGDVWLPAGLKMRQELTQFLKKKWFVNALEIGGPYGADRLELHRSMGVAKVAEIWMPTSGETCIQVSFFGKPEGEMISLLQSIGKTLTILGFDHSTVPVGREVDYLVEDGLGRVHPLVHVKKASRKGFLADGFYMTAVVERILFQMLEKNLMMVELENQ
ncbi:MAG: hypothetical protein WCF19_07635 [Chlamydiales bacterium]